MTIPLGHIRELVRYPVKSMDGIATESASLGWHGLVLSKQPPWVNR